jgi:hypothetical protein
LAQTAQTAGRRVSHYQQPFYRLRVPVAASSGAASGGGAGLSGWMPPDLAWATFRQQCAREALRAAQQHERALTRKLMVTEEVLTRWHNEVSRMTSVVAASVALQQTAEAEGELNKAMATKFETDLNQAQTAYQKVCVFLFVLANCVY